jgi:uncharacterized protein YabE (DUF348 family)/3D (Asp-Asp-Asp) domain-containing protein
MLAVALVAVVGQALADYARGLTPVVLVEDGRARRVRTRCVTVGEVLDDLGVLVGPYDRLTPDRDVALEPRMRIEVLRARPVTLVVDGVTQVVQTHRRYVDEILAEAGVERYPGDKLRVDGELRNESDLGVVHVLAASLGSSGRVERAAGDSEPVAHIEVLRAAQIQLADGEVARTLYSTADHVGQALSEANVLLYVGDRVEPGLDALLTDGLVVQIDRAKPVEVYVDGRALRTRTQSESVGDVLAEMGVSLLGQDFCDPAPDAPISDGALLRVTRVTERTEVEQEELAYETEWVADGSLELDARHLDDPGANGIRRRRYTVIYHDQRPVERVLEEDWLAQAPRPRRIAYGTKVVVRTLETPYGPIEYWRRIRTFVTAYTSATCGKTRDDPTYGVTRLGWKMQHGIIATDPRVIRLRTRLYVPGYGPGIAGDTGGLINGRHIDLGYEEGGLVWHYEWGYVYLRTPVPPAGEIPYILPDYPREK